MIFGQETPNFQWFLYMYDNYPRIPYKCVNFSQIDVRVCKFENFFKCKETWRQFSHSYLRNGLHNLVWQYISMWFSIMDILWYSSRVPVDKRGFQFKLHTQIYMFLNQFSLKDCFLQVKRQAENVIKKSLRW